jgi:hypothetical protein
MNIVIISQAKSASTAVFYTIKQALPDNTHCLFEPRILDDATRQLLSQTDNAPCVLAKVLAIHPPDHFPPADYLRFDRQILITRDPRDRQISALLYGMISSPFINDEARIEKYIDLVRQKEADPKSVSVRDLQNMYMELLELPAPRRR